MLKTNGARIYRDGFKWSKDMFTLYEINGRILLGDIVFRVEFCHLGSKITIVSYSFDAHVPSSCRWVLIHKNVCKSHVFDVHRSHEDIFILFSAAYIKGENYVRNSVQIMRKLLAYCRFKVIIDIYKLSEVCCMSLHWFKEKFTAGLRDDSLEHLEWHFYKILTGAWLKYG